MELPQTLATLDAIAAGIAEAPLKHQLQAVAHKLRFPMRDILAKVPGDTISARARKIGVSRQTLYVWMDERFRPTVLQAKAIAKITGDPITNIVDDGFVENWDDAHRKVAAKAAKLARRSAKATRADGRSRKAKRGVVAAKKRTRNPAKMRKRAGG